MSQSIGTSISALESARVAILNSINAKGGDLPSYAGFYSFAGAISNLPSGGGYTEYTGGTTLTAVMQALEQARQSIISSINAQGGSLAEGAGFSSFASAIDELNFGCSSCDDCDYCDYCDVCEGCDYCDECDDCQSCEGCEICEAECQDCQMCEYCEEEGETW